ncbi:MAG TPA: CARDB domain-containing protein [Candidatus Bathyarchaeia archaeon]|nr:CARDB domain-containing protein [Candidatus Bathyarchaeia archaeon]
MNKAIKIMLLLLALALASVLTASDKVAPFQIESASAPPVTGTYASRPSNYTFSSGVFARFPDRAYDGSNATTNVANWAHTNGAGYGTSNGYFELNVYGPRAAPPRGSRITRVDLHVVFFVVSQTSDTGATMYINYRVSPSTTNTTLQSWTRAQLNVSAPWHNRTYTNQADPNGGGWAWEDLSNLKFRFNRQDPSTPSTSGVLRIHEVWATVYYEFTQTVAIYPKIQSPIPSQVKINVTGIEELYGFEFKMTYNATAITVTSVQLGPYLNTTAGAGNTYGALLKLNDTAGFVWATQSIRGNIRGGNIAYGTWQTLATINIATQSGGPTNLNFEVKLAGHNYLIKKAYPGSFTLIQPGHDVAVTNIVPTPTTVTRGDNVTVDVTVRNDGDYIETFYLSTYANTSAATSLIETKTVSGLGLGATQVVSFTWNTRDFPRGNYTVSAVAATIGVLDTDSTDNTLYNLASVVEVNPLFGDINEDGWVSSADLAAINFSWGTQPGDLLWNLNADLSSDSFIDAEDLRLLGEAWEPPA